MKVIGITGGIGSGKSLVLQLLHEEYHAWVLEADKAAHQLMEPGQPAYNRSIAERNSGLNRKDSKRKAVSTGIFKSGKSDNLKSDCPSGGKTLY